MGQSSPDRRPVVAGDGSPPSHLRRLLFRTCRGIFSSWSLRVFLPDGRVIAPRDYPFGRQIFAPCERDIVALAAFGASGTVLIALGRDGDWAAMLAQEIGWRAVRGSSRRGGSAALRELIRGLQRSGLPAAISVDGPLGPAGEAKEGVILCAQRSGRPILPVAAAARHRVVIPGTWSGLFLPLPGTRVAAAVEEALLVPEDCSRQQRRDLAAELTRRLAAAKARAVRAVRAWPSTTARSGHNAGGQPLR